MDKDPARQAKKRFEAKINSNVKKGALHKQLGIPQGKNIPVSKLEALKNSKDPQTRKRANFALNARHWAKK